MTKEKPIRGKKTWAFAAGHIPLFSNGNEPVFTSHDKIAILNPSSMKAEISLMIYYEDTDPVKTFKFTVEAHRMRKIRFNDLINPLPVPLDTPFGFLITSNTGIIVQFSRMNTGSESTSILGTTPYHQ